MQALFSAVRMPTTTKHLRWKRITASPTQKGMLEQHLLERA